MKMNSGTIGFVVGIGSAACSIYLIAKLKRISNSVDLTVDELTKKTHIDIADALIDAAVQKAVNQEVKNVAKIASRHLTEEIKRQVKDEIHVSYSELKDSVSSEIARQVKNVDIRKIEKEAVEKAKQAIAYKFDGKLDGLLDDFNSNLNNVSKIYSSIAKTMSQKA